MKVRRIKNGTVIDHITSGMALRVVDILGLGSHNESILSIVMNVPTGNGGTKDIVKVENRELKKSEVDRIALIAPEATINLIRFSKVTNKLTVELPEEVHAIVECKNKNCITNQHEPVEHWFSVISREPLRLQCKYCEREAEDIASCLI